MSKITVTPQAEAYFKKLIDKQNMPGLAIRLSVTNPGTPDVEFGILYCPKDFITPNDEHFKFEGFDIVIDKTVSQFLDESFLDMGKDDQGEDILTFHAPNLKKSLVPEDSPLIDKVKAFFDVAVNPGLAGHGGSVAIDHVSDDGIVYVRFAGGCMGCSMVGATLQDGIKAQLTRAFPGVIKDVVDVTAHQRTDETYA